MPQHGSTPVDGICDAHHGGTDAISLKVATDGDIPQGMQLQSAVESVHFGQWGGR